VKVDIKVKISGFCRQLGDDTLERLAREEGQFAVYARARAALESGSIDQALEADLDALNAIVVASTGHGLYPTSTRSLSSLPGTSGAHGAQWWSCPLDACVGRGRVKPSQPTPTCGITGDPLTTKPLTP
jgi:hypothetical protein